MTTLWRGSDNSQASKRVAPAHIKAVTHPNPSAMSTAEHHRYVQLGEQLLTATREGNLKDVQHLIRVGGVDVDFVDSKGRTALMYAIIHGHEYIVRHLLALGANVNLTNSHRWTALHWACHSNKLSIAELLIRSGANVNITNELNQTALSKLAFSDQVRLQLLADSLIPLNPAIENKIRRQFRRRKQDSDDDNDNHHDNDEASDNESYYVFSDDDGYDHSDLPVIASVSNGRGGDDKRELGSSTSLPSLPTSTAYHSRRRNAVPDVELSAEAKSSNNTIDYYINLVQRLREDLRDEQSVTKRQQREIEELRDAKRAVEEQNEKLLADAVDYREAARQLRLQLEELKH